MRKNLPVLARLALMTLCLSALLMASAQAYLDPAATSYIIQIIAGVVIACGVTVGIFWKKVRLFFRNLKMKMLQKKLAKKNTDSSKDN